MPLATELAALFHRDLTRVTQQLEAFTDEESLWRVTGGISNSAGNLALHLEGNLREYVGRLLVGVAYARTRDAEFASKGVPKLELIARLTEVRSLVVRVVGSLTPEALEANFPENVLGSSLPTRQFLVHLFGHLNYHLGQIDYIRRVLTGQSAISLAAL